MYTHYANSIEVEYQNNTGWKRKHW